jgi:hypothetical protein
MTKLRSHLLTVLLAAAGMALGQQFGRMGFSLGVPAAHAQGADDDVVSTRQLEVVDAQGRRQIIMGTGGEGTPGVWFLDHNGKTRLSLGLYGDANASLVLNDDHERAVEIFRTVGAASDPVLVLKSEGADRVIMGLKGPKGDPGLVYFDAGGAKKAVFGDY